MLKKPKFRVAGALSLLVAVLSGCTGMVQQELDDTHAKLAALQELVATVNKEINDLDKIVSALDDTHTIKPETFQETEDGYEVSFNDGTKIFVPYGKDGEDGETLIPVGVLQEEDSLYYWQVNGEWLLDDEGNKIRAGATDGGDASVPQIKVEDGFWWVSIDGGKTFDKIASCEEMNGVGVFSNIEKRNANTLVLTLIDGTTIEIPCLSAFRISFNGPARESFAISAGELLPIPYSVLTEGNTDEPIVVTAGTDGIYTSRIVEGETAGQGIVYVQAPEVFSEGYIFLTAYCDGVSALKVYSFTEREFTPGYDSLTVRLGSGAESRSLPFKADFDCVATVDADWLAVVPGSQSDSLAFEVEPNEADTVRTCTVKVSPKDNPGYVIASFVVKQATGAFTYEVEPGGTLVCDLDKVSIEAPAEGGDALIWMTFIREIKVSSCPDWAKAAITFEDGFYKFVISVDPTESGRDGVIQCLFGNLPQDYKIIQAGKPSGE